MSDSTKAPRGLGRLLPQSLFWRLLLATLILGAFTAAGAMTASWIMGRDLLYDLQEETGYAVLRNASDLIGRTRIAIEEMRAASLAERKDTLKNTATFTTRLLDSYDIDAADPGALAFGRRAAYSHLNAIDKSLNPPVTIIDANYVVRVSPDPSLRGQDVFHLQDAQGEFALRRQVLAARTAGPDETTYDVYYAPGEAQGKPRAKLAACLYYKPWDVTACSDMFLGDINKDLAEKAQSALNELRARIQENVIAKTGYLFIFDEACNMIAHPSLSGEEFASMPLPGRTDTTLCRELKAVAEKPWGTNKLLYDWDRPEDKGHFVNPKIAWCAREPTTGWYVGASAYASELRAPLPRFILTIFLPALCSIVLLGCGLALLLRSLLRPVASLTEMCRRVGKGDLTAGADEDAPGEMGFLCRQFNVMVRALDVLRTRQRERRAELEHLNKNLERTVRLRTSALERKARKLEDANRRLKELDAMKSAFLSSVSHELRTPLTSIMGFAKLIFKDFDKNFGQPARSDPGLRAKAERIEGNVGIIMDESERLTRLINDFLDLSKIESGKVEWKDAVFNFREALDRTKAALTSHLEKKPDVRLEILPAQNLPDIRADRDRLTQVMINLVDNALKFTRTGHVTISACARDGWLQVRVSDTGMGMRRQDLVKIFDKFHQASHAGDTLLDKPKGTGLGLAICHNIITHYGGLIWAEAEVGRGATFAFEIPTAGSLAGTAPTGPSVATPPAEDAPLILAVHDQASVRRALSRLLENAGYRCVTAADGREALNLAAQFPVDLIAMDLDMPAMDGRTAISLLRGDPTLSAVPAAILPPRDDVRETGENQPLANPSDVDLFLKTVNGLLRDAPHDVPCLVVAEHAPAGDAPILLYCPERCDHCPPEELEARIEEGFSGLVFIPAPLCEVVDVKALARKHGVQAVVVPT